MSHEKGYVVPIAPAVLAAKRIAGGRFEETGLVPPDRQVDPDELCGFLESEGVYFTASGPAARRA